MAGEMHNAIVEAAVRWLRRNGCAAILSDPFRAGIQEQPDAIGWRGGEFVHTIGDAHIYLNHVDQVREQLSREPMPLAKLELRQRDSIDEYVFDDVKLVGYTSHPAIKGEVSV